MTIHIGGSQGRLDCNRSLVEFFGGACYHYENVIQWNRLDTNCSRICFFFSQSFTNKLLTYGDSKPRFIIALRYLMAIVTILFLKMFLYNIILDKFNVSCHFNSQFWFNWRVKHARQEVPILLEHPTCFLVEVFVFDLICNSFYLSDVFDFI